MLDAAVSLKQRSLPAEIPHATELIGRRPATDRTTGRARFPRPRTVTSALRHPPMRRTRGIPCGRARGCVQRRVQPPQNPRVGGSSPSSGMREKPANRALSHRCEAIAPPVIHCRPRVGGAQLRGIAQGRRRRLVRWETGSRGSRSTAGRALRRAPSCARGRPRCRPARGATCRCGARVVLRPIGWR